MTVSEMRQTEGLGGADSNFSQTDIPVSNLLRGRDCIVIHALHHLQPIHVRHDHHNDNNSKSMGAVSAFDHCR